MASAAEKAPDICRYYKAPGGCWFGKKCRYFHEGEDISTAPDTKVCRFFSSANGCRNGNKCRFLHVNDTGSDGEKCPSPTATDESNTSIDQSEQSISDVNSGEISQSDVSQSDTSTSDVNQSDNCDSPDGALVKKKETKDLLADWKPKESYSCGECKQVFKGKDAYDEILRHHTDMLCKMEKAHMAFLGTNHWFSRFVTCGACGKDFARARDLLRHLIDKSKVVKQKKDQEFHSSLLEEVARAFADRDVGLSTEEESHEELMIYLTSYMGSDQTSDSDSSDIGLGMGLYMLSHVQRLQRNSTSSNYEEELEERMANCGFTNGEVEDLMCQGIMPWDDCAYDALAVLNGEYEY